MDLCTREEPLVLIVVRLHLFVAQDRRFLVVAHHALHDEALPEVVDLPDDLGVAIIALRAASAPTGVRSG